MIFYDNKGNPVVYLMEDGEHLYFFDGTPAAYLFEDAVYAFDGSQCGWMERGWIRDMEGRCVRGPSVRPGKSRRPGLRPRPGRTAGREGKKAQKPLTRPPGAP